MFEFTVLLCRQANKWELVSNERDLVESHTLPRLLVRIFIHKFWLAPVGLEFVQGHKMMFGQQRKVSGGVYRTLLSGISCNNVKVPLMCFPDVSWLFHLCVFAGVGDGSGWLIHLRVLAGVGDGFGLLIHVYVLAGVGDSAEWLIHLCVLAGVGDGAGWLIHVCASRSGRWCWVTDSPVCACRSGRWCWVTDSRVCFQEWDMVLGDWFTCVCLQEW